ncbi:MAG: type II toxin-antitoxin system HicA family toxin [Patescibacteria group bacterium]
MSKIKPLSYREVIKKLRMHGFAFRRATGGSHEIWWNDDTKRTVVVPHHREIKPGTVRSIVKQSGISEKDFFN